MNDNICVNFVLSVEKPEYVNIDHTCRQISVQTDMQQIVELL